MAEPKAYLGNDPYIFVSYAHRNKDVVYPFIEALQEYYNVWFDDGIRYGREWEKEICSRIKNCTVFVYMITEESLASENCKDEIYMARDLGKSFLNVLVKKETKLPDEFTFRYGRFQMCNLYAFPGCAAAVLDLANKFEELGKTEKAGAQGKTEEGQFKKQEDIKYINDHFRFESRGNNTCAVFGKNKETLLPTLEIPSVSPTGEIVTEIGDSAFKLCESLTSVVIPDSVTSIGEMSFVDCTSLISLNIPGSVTSIGDYAFSGCTSLTSVTIPNGVTSIGEAAFLCCASLKSVTIPDSVMNIGRLAFNECDSLTSVYITDIAKWCAVSFDDNPLEYAHNLYFNGKLVTDLVIPEGVTSIEDYAFCRCTSLKGVTIPASVTNIGENAFAGCSSLTSVTIPGSVTGIGFATFSFCASLTSVTIPKSVTSIGGCAFYDCAALTSITYQGKKEEWEKIKKSWNWDKSKEASKYTIHCTDGDIKK